MIKNFTPHPVVIRTEEGKEIVIHPEGIIPRLETIEIPAEPIDGVPCIKRKLGKIQGLPQEKDGVFLITSSMVFEACDRKDLLCPDTGPSCIRDNSGRIIAVRRLIRK